MRISLVESHANGFNKWCAIHDDGRKHDGRPSTNGPIVAVKFAADNRRSCGNDESGMAVRYHNKYSETLRPSFDMI
jgi:hypothetical protein